MVNHTAIDKNTSSDYFNVDADNCFIKNSSSNNTQKDGPFLWSKKDQGIISSSYFAGYFLSQIPGEEFKIIFDKNKTSVKRLTFYILL